jgi:DNA-binding NarL/FixJ family response regulator
MTTDVAVVEDHPLFRTIVTDVLRDAPDLRVVGAAASIEELERTQGLPADVVLFDLHVPGRAGPDGVRYLTGRGASVLVVSAFAARDDVLNAVAAGARGYVSKETDGPGLLAAVRDVAAGGSHVSPTLAGHLMADGGDEQRDEPCLTDREREVLALLATGETDQEIARMLCISVRTVRSHLDRIRAKTGCRRRAELTRLAIESDCG